MLSKENWRKIYKILVENGDKKNASSQKFIFPRASENRAVGTGYIARNVQFFEFNWA